MLLKKINHAASRISALCLYFPPFWSSWFVKSKNEIVWCSFKFIHDLSCHYVRMQIRNMPLQIKIKVQCLRWFAINGIDFGHAYEKLKRYGTIQTVYVTCANWCHLLFFIFFFFFCPLFLAIVFFLSSITCHIFLNKLRNLFHSLNHSCIPLYRNWGCWKKRMGY